MCGCGWVSVFPPLAPRALTSSAAMRMCWAWSSSRIIATTGVAPYLPFSPRIREGG